MKKKWVKMKKRQEKGTFPQFSKTLRGGGDAPHPETVGGGDKETHRNPPVVGLCPGKKYISSNLAFIKLKPSYTSVLAYVKMCILLLINHNSRPDDYSLYVSQTACPIHCVYLTHLVKYEKSQMQYKYTMKIKNNTSKSTKKI